MGPYHAIMVHFPVSLWMVASGIIVYRALSDGELARALDRVLVPLLVIGVATGLVAYTLGQLVWPPSTLQKTPLGRNHMMGATWTLSYWAAVLFLRWRAGEHVWESRQRRLVMVILGALGAGLLGWRPRPAGPPPPALPSPSAPSGLKGRGIWGCGAQTARARRWGTGR